jgi:hypothetical protein
VGEASESGSFHGIVQRGAFVRLAAGPGAESLPENGRIFQNAQKRPAASFRAPIERQM